MPEQNDDHPLYAAVNAMLANVAAACSSPPLWYQAWAALGPQSSKEERLAVYRAVRAAGSVPADAGFFLVAWMLDLLTVATGPHGSIAILADEATLSRELRTPRLPVTHVSVGYCGQHRR